MPSDARVTRALEAVAHQVAPFRAAMSAARADMQQYLDEHRARGRDRAAAAATALGPFASGRIDVERFGLVLTDGRALADDSASRIGQCIATLDELLDRADELFTHGVGPTEPICRTVERAFSEIGRAFGASRVFRAVKAGTYDETKHAPLLVALPFARWSRTERELVPPLVIEVDGADLSAEHLTDYLDGAAKLVVIVTGDASPAPLVRLIAPRTLVMQTTDPHALARLDAWAGPAVVAVLPGTSARFVHDPRGGSRLEDRLSIDFLPTEVPRSALGWRSAAQQAEERDQLAALAEVTRAARDVAVVVMPPLPAGAAPVDGSRAVDAVASWMLAQAGFSGGGR
jgi:hypothetical protein